MPRRQKNKCARRKHHQVRGETLNLGGAEAAAAAEECPSSPVSRGSPPSPPGPSLEVQEAPASSSPGAGVSCPRADDGAERPAEESTNNSPGTPSTQSADKNPLSRKGDLLVQFLLERYKMDLPITQAAMRKVIGRKYCKYFPDILHGVSEFMEVICGLELKDVNPRNHMYVLVNMLGLPSDSGLGGDRSVPKTGLLMNILGLIFMKGSSVTEEEIWDCLSVLGIYAGQKHHILGEPKKLIQKDLVQQKYLECRQVANSDPPRYEFLWGPRAYVETTKMRVLEYLARVYDTVPPAFPYLYVEALIDEKEGAEVRAIARAASIAKASEPRGGKSCSSSHT